MRHVFADSQQDGFFAYGLFISASCQQAVAALLVLTNQGQIENGSRECWSDMDGLIWTYVVRDDRGLYPELGLCVVSRDRVAGIKARMWEKLRARNQTILLFSRGFDIGDLDVEILFERQINSSGKCQLLAAGSSILGHCAWICAPKMRSRNADRIIPVTNRSPP